MAFVHVPALGPHLRTSFARPTSLSPRQSKVSIQRRLRFSRTTPSSCTSSPTPTTPSATEPMSSSSAPSDDASGSTVRYYFSYGSNMSREKMKARTRGDMVPITYSDVMIGCVRDWELCFNLAGAPPMEPAMGSIRQRQGATVYGVVYRIDNEESWKSLLRTEGIVDERSKFNAYKVVQVEATCYRAGEEDEKQNITVWTLITFSKTKLISEDIDEYLRPSRRYVKLLIDGAKSEGLPAEYVKKLEAIPTARQWGLSPLMLVMTLCFPLYFMSEFAIGRMIRYPVIKYGFQLFAWHEALVWKERRTWKDGVLLWVYSVSMFIVFGLAAIPSVIMAMFRPRSRRMFMFLLRRRLSGNKAAPQNGAANSTRQ